MKQFLSFLVLLALASSGFAADSSGKPNIVVILSDDYGYGSAGCFGGPGALKTPNLDRLASQGRRFTNAYATGSVCSPTRYALMTGRYFWRTPIKDGNAIYDIRMGDWKLIERANAPAFESVRNRRKAEQAVRRRRAAADQKDELYNLKDDPAETKNVFADNAELAASMKKVLTEARDRGFTRPDAGK